MAFISTRESCLLSTYMIKRYKIFCRCASTVEIKDVFDAVKEGSLEKIQRYQTDKEISSVRDRSGWSLLHHAVKLGHLPMVKQLIASGANPGITTYTGQNAYDLANFWKQHAVKDYLENTTDAVANKKLPVFFTQSPLERHAERRNDDQWLLSAVGNPETKFILMHKSQPIVVESTDKSGRLKRRLLQCSILETHSFIRDNRQNLLFLGIVPNLDTSEEKHSKGSVNVDLQGSVRGTAWFAIDVSHINMTDIQLISETAEVLSVYPGVLQLSAADASIVAQARSLTDWHFRYKFCPTCGSKTVLSESGYKRICQDSTCLSHSGLFNTNYPRVDPTVISTVLSPNKDHCLLARKKSFPPGMFTCVAGFVEPGESMESACMREVKEEVGVKVIQVDYITSQPWPMPSVLMLGCHAYAETQCDIKLDEDELEEAQWFSRQDVVEMITHTHKHGLFVPPHQAIAHQIIKAWLLQTS